MLDNSVEDPRTDVSPLLTIISAVYNVAAYLPEYLASLEDQQVAPGSFEVILVSDGSPDESEEIITNWISNTKVSAKLLRKENGGQASARNLGLDHAKGDWVTFCDPDDYLSEDYLVELFANMESNRQNPPSMYVTRLVSFLEGTGEFSHRHPLRRRFRDGTRVVNLDRSPDFFHMHGPTAVVQRKIAEHISLRFEEKLRFSFEDAHYVATYLLAQESPTIGYVTTANYIYRVRAAGNSSVQLGGTKPEKYTDVLLFGHLDLLAQCASSNRPAPRWLQFMLLYDILWYFRGDRKVGAPSRRLSSDVTDQFHKHMSEILEGISEEAIQDFEIMPTDGELRNALILGYKKPVFRSPAVSVMDLDGSRKMTHLQYIFSGPLPDESITYRGLSRSPRIAKSQAVVFLGKTLFSYRHLWIPSTGTFSVDLDGKTRGLEFGSPRRPIHSLRPIMVERHFSRREAAGSTPIAQFRGLNSKNKLKRAVGQTLLALYESKTKIKNSRPRRRSDADKLRSFVTSPRSQMKFQTAWVLMDRVNVANDNAEHLYRFIAANKPGVNAWFVLDRESADWSRLAGDGFKLLAFGSKEHYAALVNAKVYASSHLDRFVTSPLPNSISGLATWKFVFLQHGVTLHDQSAWFNSKKIDLLLTATHDEYESIVSNDSGYRFSSKEVALTGFPRHDALLRAKSRHQHHNLIVVSPTWRSTLLAPADARGNREVSSAFASSSYAAGLRSILSDEDFVADVARLGYKLAYLPHPMFAGATDELALSPDVSVLSWDDRPFAEVVGESAVWITDYSSTAFEAAYANVPVIYFQSDADEVAAGSHIYDSGYFSFEEDGFGPVTVNKNEVMSALASISRNEAQDLYEARRRATFAHQDSGNAVRAVKAIESLFRPTAIGDQLAEIRS